MNHIDKTSVDEARVHEIASVVAAGDLKEAPSAIENLRLWTENHGDAILLKRVSWVLRHKLSAHHAIDTLLISCLSIESVRSEILFELGYFHAYQARPDEAIGFLSIGLSEGRFGAEGVLFTAVQYARLGDTIRAMQWLKHAVVMKPALGEEAIATLQFFRFIWRYDVGLARLMLDDVLSSYRSYDASSVEEEVSKALALRQPYLLLRLGDGEGSCIYHDLEDEERYCALYAANREEFLKIWFEDTSVIRHKGFDEAIAAFNAVIPQADAIGGIYRSAIDCEYGLGSRRGISWIVNSMRKVLDLAAREPARASSVGICDLTIHYGLLLTGALSRLLQGREQLGLISCHESLASMLQQKYSIGSVEFIKVPGEKSHSNELGSAACVGTHWPDRYREVCAICDGDRSGELFLVAAGFLGKIYAGRLKAAGAVVLDIGAVADLWMGKSTRDFFPQIPAEHML